MFEIDFSLRVNCENKFERTQYLNRPTSETIRVIYKYKPHTITHIF